MYRPHLVVMLVAATVAVIGCNRRQSEIRGASEGGTVPGAPQGFHAVAALPGAEWQMPAGDYANLRYSTLDTITPQNVRTLHVTTSFSTGIPNGHEGQPLVVNN